MPLTHSSPITDQTASDTTKMDQRLQRRNMGGKVRPMLIPGTRKVTYFLTLDKLSTSYIDINSLVFIAFARTHAHIRIRNYSYQRITIRVISLPQG